MAEEGEMPSPGSTEASVGTPNRDEKKLNGFLTDQNKGNSLRRR